VLIFKEIDNFFHKENVSEKDEIAFNFKRKTFTAVAKVLIITR